MPFGMKFSSDTMASAPLYGDSAVQRPKAVLRRQSAPPRPPRPELRPWPTKTLMEESVVEVHPEDFEQWRPAVAEMVETDNVYMTAYDFVRTEQPPSVAGPHWSEQTCSGVDRARALPLPVSRVSETTGAKTGSMLRTQTDRRSPSYHSYHHGRLNHQSSLRIQAARNAKNETPPFPLSDDSDIHPALRRRPFSFESIRSAASVYSQQTKAALMPEQLHVPYQPAYIYDEYAEIARSNPFRAPTEPMQRQASATESDHSFGVEPSRQSSQARNSDYGNRGIPLSRYNSQRGHPPTPDRDEARRQLDEAWEEVKKAVAPKLRISVSPNEFLARSNPHRLSTTHALPPSPPPPPVPNRNPRRRPTVKAAASQQESLTPSPRRLLHSTSSPNFNKGHYHPEQETPPVPPMHVRSTTPPAPLPAQNMPINIPAPLPTPTSSDCGSDGASYESPVSYSASMRRSNSHFSGGASGSLPSPITEQSISSMGSVSSGHSNQAPVSPLSSPPARGFHEPPPVASSLKPQPKPTPIPVYSQPSHTRGWSDSRIGVTTAIWAGSAPPVSYVDVKSQLARQSTLKSIAPGESAARQSYQAPAFTAPGGNTRASFVTGSEGGHFIQSTLKSTEDFAPIKVIPVPNKKKVSTAGENLPRFSNNFAGFCKGAWRLQTAQTGKAFALRTTQRTATLPNSTVTTTKTTTLRCGKCSFEGPLTRHPATLASMAGYAPSIDYLACADRTPVTAHGVVYRWSFLFKSHMPCKTTLRKHEVLDVEKEVYACVFCCADGKGTVCFKGVKTLCGHISQHHAEGSNLDRELRQRVGVIVARQPEKNENWDIVLPGYRQEA